MLYDPPANLTDDPHDHPALRQLVQPVRAQGRAGARAQGPALRLRRRPARGEPRRARRAQPARRSPRTARRRRHGDQLERHRAVPRLALSPAGLMETAQRDLDLVLDRLEQALAPRGKPWPFGAPGVAECAWFANLIAVRPMGFAFDAARLPSVAAWLGAMRAHPIFAADARRTGAYLRGLKTTSVERRKLFWSGERIEWLLARGFHDWLFGEIAAGRAVFPD